MKCWVGKTTRVQRTTHARYNALAATSMQGVPCTSDTNNNTTHTGDGAHLQTSSTMANPCSSRIALRLARSALTEDRGSDAAAAASGLMTGTK